MQDEKRGRIRLKPQEQKFLGGGDSSDYDGLCPHSRVQISIQWILAAAKIPVSSSAKWDNNSSYLLGRVYRLNGSM